MAHTTYIYLDVMCVNLFSPKHACHARVHTLYDSQFVKHFSFLFFSLRKTRNTIEVINNHLRRNLNTRQDCIQWFSAGYPGGTQYTRQVTASEIIHTTWQYKGFQCKFSYIKG